MCPTYLTQLSLLEVGTFCFLATILCALPSEFLPLKLKRLTDTTIKMTSTQRDESWCQKQLFLFSERISFSFKLTANILHFSWQYLCGHTRSMNLEFFVQKIWNFLHIFCPCWKKKLYEKYLVAIDKDKIITKIILNHVEQGNPINSRKNTYPKNKIK